METASIAGSSGAMSLSHLPHDFLGAGGSGLWGTDSVLGDGDGDGDGEGAEGAGVEGTA